MLGRAVHMDVINARSTPGLQPKIPLSPSERISMPYPLEHELDLVVPNADEQTPNDLLTLDLEGRALVLDFGLFVLINLYCQNEGSDARFSYKMNYHLMLQERVCPAPIDHCDEHLPSNASTFWEHPARAWIPDWLEPRGPLIDVLRRFWPDRKGMFTCWNTKINAREANYGTRIDYVLVTPGLMPWIKAADIQPSIKGSDQLLPSRLTLAVKYWPEFQGKQLLMSNFFTKRGAEALPSQAPTAPPNGMFPLTIGFDALNAQPQPVFEEQQSAPNAPLQVSSSGQPDIEPSSQSSMSPSSTQTSLKP
ncbi:Endonuclease/exonuclease/phosphatase [Russula emetica]|nr:Endonuclease/exonuclease/phosphatase [Russula emetica]